MILAFLLACATSEDPCTTLCMDAADLYGGCLTSWGASWEAAGYADEADFLDACATWAWEGRQLEAEAGEPGATEDVCRSRDATFTAEDATCDDFTAVDWSAVPWRP